MQTLRDILDLPEEVTKSAFVVRLAEAVHHPDALLATYAITPDIHGALDRGLGLVGNALREQRNDAASFTAALALARATSWRCSACLPATPSGLGVNLRCVTCS